MEEEFEERISEMNMITGSVIKEFDDETQGLTAQDILESMEINYSQEGVLLPFQNAPYLRR